MSDKKSGKPLAAGGNTDGDGAPALGRRVKLAAAGTIYRVDFCQDQGLLLTSGANGEVALWSLTDGRRLGEFVGHTEDVNGVAIGADGKHILTGSRDKTLRLWNISDRQCQRVFTGHTDEVNGVAIGTDGRRTLSTSDDQTLRLWDMASGASLRVFKGHTDVVYCAIFCADGKHALSGSFDHTLRLWDIDGGQCKQVLKGHTGVAGCVAASRDGRFAVSGSNDATLRLWDLALGRCLRVFEGHTDRVRCVAFSADGRHLLSGANDGTIRLWDRARGLSLLSFVPDDRGFVMGVAFGADGRNAFSVDAGGNLWQLDISTFIVRPMLPESRILFRFTDPSDYTNAKVLLVGATHSGKTGLTERLARDTFTPSESTSGVWATQWTLAAPTAPAQTDAGANSADDPARPTPRKAAGNGAPEAESDNPGEREVWLWDFGGQADQRLIHQLFIDGCALILLMFDADQDDALPGVQEWQTALRRCVPETVPKLLIAGRSDAGFKVNRAKMRQFATDNGFAGYYETSAKLGSGCADLRDVIAATIPWGLLTRRSSPRIFKLIKDAILALRDEGFAVVTFDKLHSLLATRLQAQLLPDEALDETLDEATLKTVLGLLEGPGVVQQLSYGEIVLLLPEWINAYAQAVIRTLRADPQELGCLPLGAIAEGKLVFQTLTRVGDGVVEMARLPQPEERIVLREMERQLEERLLCLRQDGNLVFPSHCGREREALPHHPSVFVSYAVTGYLDDIYATLVVKLAQSVAFELDKVWRDAADFFTLSGKHRMGIKLAREHAGAGQFSVYFADAVCATEQVIFANYIHEHLQKSSDSVTRLRHYVCPHCHTPKPHSMVLVEKLHAKGEQAKVVCDRCDGLFPLWDDLERRFADAGVAERVRALQQTDDVRLDSRRKGKLLALEASSRITSADQKCFEIPGSEDEGIDLELEFTDDAGRGTARKMFLQLKSGNSHLRPPRKSDGAEVFDIKEQRWVTYWLKHKDPVMLVIGTFDPEQERRGGKEKLEFASVRWMEIGKLLARESAAGLPVKSFVFAGETMDRASIMRWRKQVLDA